MNAIQKTNEVLGNNPAVWTVEVNMEGYNAFPMVLEFPNLVSPESPYSHCNEWGWCTISGLRLIVNSILSHKIGNSANLSNHGVASLMEYQTFDPAHIGSMGPLFYWLTRKNGENNTTLNVGDISQCNFSPTREDGGIYEIHVPRAWVTLVTYAAKQGFVAVEQSSRAGVVVATPWDKGMKIPLFCRTLVPVPATNW